MRHRKRSATADSEDTEGPEASGFDGGPRHHGITRGFGHTAPPEAGHGSGFLLPIGTLPLLLKIGVVGIGLTLWAKASGLVKWARVILGGLALAIRKQGESLQNEISRKRFGGWKQPLTHRAKRTYWRPTR